MSRRQKYFLKQKLFGVAVVAFSIIAVPLMDGDATQAVIFVPLGLYMMFTKEMCLYDDYYFEVQERRRKRHDCR